MPEDAKSEPRPERTTPGPSGEHPAGSAAPEHDMATSPGVTPAGPHGWPLPAGTAPTVTGEDEPSPRDAAGSPEASLPDGPVRTP
jgi:hypothetical protein